MSKPMDRQGLVAPVWSDAGEEKEAPNFCAGPLWDTYEVSYDDILNLALQFKQPYSFEGIQWPTFTFDMSKQETRVPLSDLIAKWEKEDQEIAARRAKEYADGKPAIPALTRVSGNKRGPGWCDE